MQKLHFKIEINAPKEKVWHTMLDKETYPQWTDIFGPGSNYQGDWKEGSKILFVAPNKNGKLDGMVSRIKENKEYKFISIEHFGVLQDGVEDTTSDTVKNWAGALENYTFIEKDGKTEVLVDMDSDDEYSDMFLKLWPQALNKVKALAENS
jgi:uncharacterized protein YndB with AHSA1/START domain